MVQTQDLFTDLDDFHFVVCRECKTQSAFDMLIDVDPIHVQCPSCLFVFFLDKKLFKESSAASRPHPEPRSES